MTPDGGRCARNTGGEPRQVRVFEVPPCVHIPRDNAEFNWSPVILGNSDG